MPPVNGAVHAGTVPRQRLDTRRRAVRGRIVLAGPRIALGLEETALELDEIATFIWRRIDGVRTVRQLAEAVAAAYDADLETVTDDVVELIGEFLDHQVVELVSPSEQSE